MSDNTLAKKKPEKILAIELFALNPTMTIKEVSERVGVTDNCISKWREDPNFIDKIYERYMTEFGSQLPAVINSMVREAKHGNVQAARLVLEHSGKLVKNVNITVDSPFEKFLKADNVLDAEVIEAFDEVEVVGELPERKKSTPIAEERIVVKKIIDKEKKKKSYNEKQKEWYQWKKRAKAVGIEPLKASKPTKGQRKEWEQSIVRAEEG
jgi:hypothetical protein|tara:strand:- start:636 stop:1265 length:630 start_codon:yes stop_codon:yes gene_type:complete